MCRNTNKNALPHCQHLLDTYEYCYLRQQASDCFLAERVFNAHSMQMTYHRSNFAFTSPEDERKKKVYQW